jgi:hypothetical protein
MGPGGGAMGGRLWSEWPEPERRQVEKFIEENFPRMFVELERLKDASEMRYIRRMTRIAPQMRRMMETMRTDPQLGALMIRERQIEMEIWQAVARYRHATNDEDKEKLRTRLNELAGKAFDCRHERRELEVRQLEARLSVLKTRLSESEKMRKELIAGRVTELLEHKAPIHASDDADDSGEE